MARTPATASSTPRLSEVARHVVIPEGIVTTAWPRVVAKCREFGVEFDSWQHGIGAAALGKRADGKYAATVGGVVLSIPRQVGKTFLVGMVIIALCCLFPGLTVLWTAHRTRTTSYTFASLQGMVRRKKVWPLVAAIRTANGEQEIRFKNGSAILFGAREQGFGRGFDEVDIEVFDEGQILTEKALEDMVAATNQSRHEAGALLFFMGTPPRPTDPGKEFTNRRDKALSGKASNMMYVEFSADPGADPDDRKQWEKANPSFPSRTPVESMERMREQLTDEDSFKREALGIWDPIRTHGVIPMGQFAGCADAESLPTDRFSLGVEVGPDLKWASVVFAGERADGLAHFEVDADQYTHGQRAEWVESHVKHLVDNNPQIRAVAVDVAGPIKALLEQYAGGWRFRESKIRVEAITVAELGAETSRFLSDVVTGGLRYIPVTQLTSAATVAGKRPLGDTGTWVFSRKSATSDITQIQAAVLALWASRKTRVHKPGRPVREGGRKYVTRSRVGRGAA